MAPRYPVELDACVEGWYARAETDAEGTLAALAADVERARASGTDIGAAHLNYGNVLLRLSKTAEALAQLAQAVEASRAEEDGVVEMHALMATAKTLAVTGDLPMALANFQEGLALARRAGDRYTEGLLLANLGFFHGRLREAAAYEEYTRLALERLREFDNRRAVVLCLNNLAGAVSWLGRFDEAMVFYDEALPIAVALGLKRGQALILGGLGGVLLRLARVDEGTQKYLESIALLREIGDAFLVTRHYMLLGESLVGAGRHADALPFLAEAVRGAEAGSFELELAMALELTSKASEATGDLRTALDALRRQVELEKAAIHRRSEEQIENLKLEHRLAAAKHDATARAARNAELEAVNAALRASLERQHVLQAELERLASTDVLTGLRNRRSVSDVVEREIARAARTGRSFAVLLADVDHFKRINDVHGHAVGDAVLVELAARFRATLRISDAVGRWGGEEFCVVVVEVDVAGAERAAERLRAAVAKRPFATDGGALPVTVSVGVAMFRGAGDTLARLLHAADEALYAAKGAGRDRWCLAPVDA